MKINNVDKIFVVHWKKLAERKNYIDNYLIDEDIIWLDMYDRDTISDDTVSELFTYDNEELWYNRVNGLYKNVPTFRNLKMSEICNSLSHIKALDYIIENNIETSLILEDDVIFIDDFKFKFNDKIKKTPDFDVIFLGNSFSIDILDNVGCEYSSPAKLVNDGVYEKIRNPKTRTVDSYVIKYNSAKRIRRIIDRISLPYDFDLAYFIKELDLKVYWWSPGLVTQGSMSGKYSSSIR